MAAASDKARFYLEESVPELREWERREIFSKDEITSIASKRSDFEHVLSARGSKPSDYTRYAEYEMNLDTLRRKRVKRKGVKATAHTGQRRIFFILDRATRKFHGDVGLWLQYIDYARTQRANKKLTRILTDALRMHPTRPELWIYAARYAIDVQADIGSARSYMQRGLRFCKTSKQMYVEYARLEMGYIAKIAARKKILGVDGSAKQSATDHEMEEQTPNPGADMIELPTITAGEVGAAPNAEAAIDGGKLRDLSLTPAMSGSIPLAIFNAALVQFKPDLSIGSTFFDMFADFPAIPSLRSILQIVVEQLSKLDPLSPASVSCRSRLHLIGIVPDALEYPDAVRAMVKDVRTALASAKSAQKSGIAEEILPWLHTVTREERLGPELRQVLLAIQTRLSRELPSDTQSQSI